VVPEQLDTALGFAVEALALRLEPHAMALLRVPQQTCGRACTC
jgi:hypothetical protein